MPPSCSQRNRAVISSSVHSSCRCKEIYCRDRSRLAQTDGGFTWCRAERISSAVSVKVCLPNMISVHGRAKKRPVAGGGGVMMRSIGKAIVILLVALGIDSSALAEDQVKVVVNWKNTIAT